MKKLMQKEIEQEAKRVNEEYAYMDKMPLKGWMWEFMRRSPECKQFYEKFQKLSKQGTVLRKTMNSLRNEYDVPIGILIEPKELPEHCTYSFNVTQSIVVACQNTDNRPDVLFVLPDYQRSFNDFVFGGSHPVHIAGIDPYQILNRDSWYQSAKHYSRRGFHEKFKSCLMEFPRDMGMDTLEGLEQNVFVRISTKSNERDLKKLLKEVKDWLSPEKHRVRDKKWKHYLVVYDLKEQHTYTYNNIADILNLAFPKKRGQVYDQTNIQYHYNQAVQLIDKGTYKEYLHYR